MVTFFSCREVIGSLSSVAGYWPLFNWKAFSGMALRKISIFLYGIYHLSRYEVAVVP